VHEQMNGIYKTGLETIRERWNGGGGKVSARQANAGHGSSVSEILPF
jgi:hypothetical protein